MNDVIKVKEMEKNVATITKKLEQDNGKWKLAKILIYEKLICELNQEVFTLF